MHGWITNSILKKKEIGWIKLFFLWFLSSTKHFNKGNQIKLLKQGNIKTKNALHSQLPEILRFKPLTPRSNLLFSFLSYHTIIIRLVWRI